jgi:hypothetical protein
VSVGWSSAGGLVNFLLESRSMSSTCKHLDYIFDLLFTQKVRLVAIENLFFQCLHQLFFRVIPSTLHLWNALQHFFHYICLLFLNSLTQADLSRSSFMFFRHLGWQQFLKRLSFCLGYFGHLFLEFSLYRCFCYNLDHWLIGFGFCERINGEVIEMVQTVFYG